MIRLTLTLFLLLASFTIGGCSTEVEGKDESDKENTNTSKKELKVEAKNVSPADFRYEVRDTNNTIVALETNHGQMVLELYHDVAPAHADSFAARVNDEFYKNLIFHRVIDGFMIQGGDPTGTGMGDAGYNIKAEFSDIPHIEGTLSMARSNDPNSASCQFFVCLGRTAQLDGKYSVFGHLLKGYDVLHAIGSTKTAAQNRPVEEVKILECYESDAEGNRLSEDKD